MTANGRVIIIGLDGVPFGMLKGFAETGVDTAIFSTPVPVPFEVWNVTDSINMYKEKS